MTEIVRLIASLEGLLQAIFFVVGIIFVILALRQSIQRAEFGPQHGSWFRPVLTFTIGILLIAFPSTISVLSNSLFGQAPNNNPRSIFEYDRNVLEPLNQGPARDIVGLIMLFVRFVGYIAVIRGLLLFNQISTQGSRVVGAGITFLIAGTICINFPIFWGLLVDLVIPNSVGTTPTL